MLVEITARHFEASDKLKKYVNRELEKLPKYFDRIMDTKVILEEIKEKQYKIEIHCNVPGKSLLAEASDTEPTKATDDVVNKMIRQLKKYKDGLKNH
ncbi:MAG: ribosome-associated translation inhibitor RaiA [Candidatus Marinimicrobia bacterium]|nr:ribosome-associated translation inhibitor RaiA [Candidatus Neomarinimicrobiota bacterium]